MRSRYHRHIYLAALFVVMTCGCVTEWHNEFRGSVARDGATPPPTTLTLACQFHFRDKDVTDAVTGYCLGASNGMVLFVHDRQKFVSSDFRVSTDAVSAVYLADWLVDSNEPWKPFIKLGEAARDSAEGVHRLQGTFNVERWKSDGDFRLRLAMRSAGPEPRSIDGVLTAYERTEFRPGKWFAYTLWSLGLTSPTESNPTK